MDQIIIALGEEAELRVIFGGSNSVGQNAFSILFNPGAVVAGETTSTTYNGYCQAEIVLREAARYASLDVEVVRAIMESEGVECECDREFDAVELPWEDRGYARVAEVKIDGRLGVITVTPSGDVEITLVGTFITLNAQTPLPELREYSRVAIPARGVYLVEKKTLGHHYQPFSLTAE